MRCGKKGQAAMEFLMTYGWALVVVLVAIGALAFFGVLNPGRFLPETCVLGPGFACDDFKITKDSTGANANDNRIYITVRNGIGVPLDLFAVYVAKEVPNGINEPCGGSVGFIAISNMPGPTFNSVGAVSGSTGMPGGDPRNNIFPSGEARPLLALDEEGTGGFDYLPGINCNRNSPTGSFNCCAAFNQFFDDPDGGGPALGAQPFCRGGAGGYVCPINSPMPDVGDKFSEDLVIVYREQAGSIIHSRIGKISGQIEKP